VQVDKQSAWIQLVVRAAALLFAFAVASLSAALIDVDADASLPSIEDLGVLPSEPPPR
jgi:hypothetical protein